MLLANVFSDKRPLKYPVNNYPFCKPCVLMEQAPRRYSVFNGCHFFSPQTISDNVFEVLQDSFVIVPFLIWC